MCITKKKKKKREVVATLFPMLPSVICYKIHYALHTPCLVSPRASVAGCTRAEINNMSTAAHLHFLLQSDPLQIVVNCDITIVFIDSFIYKIFIDSCRII